MARDLAVDKLGKIKFPEVRNAKPSGLIGHELIKVQPMSVPSGLLFYLDYIPGQKGLGSENSLGRGGKIKL
jgi:hypothetical protein